jgi:formylglycine-generating enzyme required for sulfatase activity
MGMVYRARQLHLNRDVALKVLPPVLANDPSRLERFRHEAALAASLNDSHILPVHDVLDTGNGPILVMPFIDGCTLAQVIDDESQQPQAPESARPAPRGAEYVQRVLALLDQLVEAVAVLDRVNILHRDIKPSNILIDRQEHVWLADFGLARLGRESQGTIPGTSLGTPGYISPEQARGEADLDSRTDVFSVGVTMYHALTGRLPYGKGILTTETPLATAPSKHQPGLTADMDAVILMAVEPDRAKRYASASDLRDDWKCVRQGLTPLARRVTRLARLGRWVRRHRWQVASLAVIFLLASVVAAMAMRPSPPPGDGGIRHRVHVQTNPAGAEIVLVPVNEYGELQPRKRIRPRGKTPLVIPNVPAGEYLVVVNLPGQGFHEVYRIVPGPEQAAGIYLHNRWEESPDHTIEVPPIDIPRTAAALAKMVHIQGGEFTMGSDGRDGKSWVKTPVGPAHKRTVAPYYLDPTEVTVKAYLTQKRSLPPGMETHYPKRPDNFDRFPVTHVTWDQAREAAERLGKRLPTEEEYEFTATSGGTCYYPWGNDGERVQQIVWRAGPVGEPDFDCVVMRDGKVFGLYSNVAEWSEERLIQYSPDKHPSRLRTGVNGDVYFALFKLCRVVRGAPYTEVLAGQTTLAERDRELKHGPLGRFQFKATSSSSNLGFRCARSDRPRFLD